MYKHREICYFHHPKCIFSSVYPPISDERERKSSLLFAIRNYRSFPFRSKEAAMSTPALIKGELGGPAMCVEAIVKGDVGSLAKMGTRVHNSY